MALLRVAAGEVHAMGYADRNATIAGDNVTLDSTGVIAGNGLHRGRKRRHQKPGPVRGSLMASGGKVVLNGPVGRDVEVSPRAPHRTHTRRSPAIFVTASSGRLSIVRDAVTKIAGDLRVWSDVESRRPKLRHRGRPAVETTLPPDAIRLPRTAPLMATFPPRL